MDSQLDELYSSAGKKLDNLVNDWTDSSKWIYGVSRLDTNERYVYLLAILSQQVINGGFMQYFDNSYGMFAFETLEVLNQINATKTQLLLNQAITIINVDGLTGKDFKNFVWSNAVPEDLCKKLDSLDDQYYELEMIENLETLMESYLSKK